MKHTIHGFITHTKGPWSDVPEIAFSMYKPSFSANTYTVVVKPHSFEVEIPDDFDSTLAKIVELENAKRYKANIYLAERESLDKAIRDLCESNKYPPSV